MTEDYLKALYAAEERGEGALGVTEIARRMNVVASTASENVGKLQRQGLVEHAKYQKVHLTERGREMAIATVRRHRILETYLYEKLEFAWDEVHREAEVLEHAMSATLLERMDRALGHPQRDPHGDPIPQPGQTQRVEADLPLLDLSPGQGATVTRISDADPALLRYLEARGVVLDAQVTVREKLTHAGLVDVEVCPPQHWRPRTREQLRPGVSPGQTTSVTLGDRAAEAISVSV